MLAAVTPEYHVIRLPLQFPKAPASSRGMGNFPPASPTWLLPSGSHCLSLAPLVSHGHSTWKNTLDGGLGNMCPNSRWETLLHNSRMENEEGINVPWKSEYLLALEEKDR